MDEMSDLPDPIVHQIMSCLNVSEMITRISTLSKRFFSIWSSYPVIVFDEMTFARTLQGRLREDTIKDRFLDHIYNLVLRRRIDRVLSEFRVKANLGKIYTDNRFDSVIAIVLVNGVRCLRKGKRLAKDPYI
ncbi:F-box domain, cyclin-like protein [Artemisia annua]|uniref:F-box domain, cyclin-like protein n=1 Tax=Artemisia annua TaxID=35608 RepID=A0A2U1NAC3_ARTAN|nr:F-box domain, cyclin-like protein [Artemisia annua]